MRPIQSLVYSMMLVFCLNACALRQENDPKAQKSPAHSVNHGSAEGYISKHENCYGQWERLVDEWRKEGGILGSMQETRIESVERNESTLATGIRRAWAIQEESRSALEKEPIGSWPLNEDRYREVMLSTLDAFESGLSEDCRSVSWLGPILWDEVRGTGKAEISNTRLRDVPEAVRHDATSAMKWLMYWLFVKPEPKPDR